MALSEERWKLVKRTTKGFLYVSVGMTLATMLAMPGLFFFGFQQVQGFQYFLLPLVTVVIVKEVLEFAFRDLIITEPRKNDLQKRLYTSSMAAYAVPLVIALANGQNLGAEFILTLPGWISLIVFAPLSFFLLVHMGMSVVKITPPLTKVITKQVSDDFKLFRNR